MNTPADALHAITGDLADEVADTALREQ